MAARTRNPLPAGGRGHVLPTQARRPTRKPSRRIFISYGHADAADCVEFLRGALGHVYEIVFDRDFMIPGRRWGPQIEAAIKRADVFIVVLTPSAMRDASFCINEVLFARKFPQVRMIPLMWKLCDVRIELLGDDYIDFCALGHRRALASLRDAIEGKPLAPNHSIPRRWSLAPSFQSPLRDTSRFYNRRWLLEEIGAWRSASGAQRALLVTGAPGTGKSSIITKLIGDEEPCGRVFAYHFCIRERTSDSSSLVRNIAYMLAHHLPEYADALSVSLFRDEITELKANIFFERAILDLLNSIDPPTSLAGKPGWILIDALDEAMSSIDAQGNPPAAALISEIMHRIPDWLRLLVTCRPGPVARQIEHRLEKGRPLVRAISLDDRSPLADARECLEQAYAAAGQPAPAEPLKSLVVSRSAGNLLYLNLVVDRLLATGECRAAEIERFPPGLHEFYSRDFNRLYPPPENMFRARPLLAIILAARERLSAALLAAVTGYTLSNVKRELERLAAYVPERDQKYAIFHTSLDDWFLDPETDARFAVDKSHGHKYLAQFCQNMVQDAPDGFDIDAYSDDDAREYFVRQGIGHCLAAGEVAWAIELLHFIKSGWDEDKARTSPFSSVAPQRSTRTVLLALGSCGNAMRRDINPYHLADLIRDFYQVEPLHEALKILVRMHREAWPSIMKQLLTAENYVLRFCMSKVLAEFCENIDLIESYSADEDINLHELGTYALCHIYASRPDLINMEHLERMGDSETYPAISALSSLLIYLSFQGRPVSAQLKSAKFWNPIWHHTKVSVWDLQAADLLVARKRPPADADNGVKASYDHFESTEKLRRNLLDLPDIRSDRHLHRLIEDFHRLPEAPERIRAAKHLATNPHLRDVLLLLFSHPLWNVAETAASVLASIVEVDRAKESIITDFLGDEYWRVRFGAIEAAYQLADIGIGELFFAAVADFHADDDSRVRALCAENFTAYLLARPPSQRQRHIDEFSEALHSWLFDEDCWVLEHVFRLLRGLARDGYDCDQLFRSGTPYLLEGLSGWATLPRKTFLLRIEEQRRKQVTATSGCPSSSPPSTS